MADLKQRLVLVAALLSPWMLAPHVQADEELIQLLQDKRCPRCQLADVDLVQRICAMPISVVQNCNGRI